MLPHNSSIQASLVTAIPAQFAFGSEKRKKHTKQEQDPTAQQAKSYNRTTKPDLFRQTPSPFVSTAPLLPALAIKHTKPPQSVNRAGTTSDVSPVELTASRSTREPKSTSQIGFDVVRSAQRQTAPRMSLHPPPKPSSTRSCMKELGEFRGRWREREGRKAKRGRRYLNQPSRNNCSETPTPLQANGSNSAWSCLESRVGRCGTISRSDRVIAPFCSSPWGSAYPCLRNSTCSATRRDLPSPYSSPMFAQSSSLFPDCQKSRTIRSGRGYGGCCCDRPYAPCGSG